jgi:hypothetical protein
MRIVSEEEPHPVEPTIVSTAFFTTESQDERLFPKMHEKKTSVDVQNIHFNSPVPKDYSPVSLQRDSNISLLLQKTDNAITLN